MTKLGNRLSAWKKLFKLYSYGKFSKELDEFFRNIVILGLKDNFLNFLQQPHTFSEIKDEFKVIDNDFLYLLLDTLLSDNTIEKTGKGFLLKKSLDVEAIPPKIFDKSLQEICENVANAVFDRLYNKFYNVTSGFNLFVFDDALSVKGYEDIRRVAISFVPESIENPGRFLDLGCGSGISTADFWFQMIEKCNYQPQNGFKLIGIDIDEGFVNIAKKEFYYILKKYIDLTEDTYLDLKPYHPEFKEGTTTQIPYPDKYFDFIYISQVLHWSDLKSSLAEIHRCLKPEGICFGTNILFPQANHYLNIMANTIEGAGGFFTKEEFMTAAKEVGFSNIKFCTPVTVFKFKK